MYSHLGKKERRDCCFSVESGGVGWLPGVTRKKQRKHTCSRISQCLIFRGLAEAIGRLEGPEEIIAMGLVDFHSWDLCSSENDIRFLGMPVFDTCWQHVHN